MEGQEAGCRKVESSLDPPIGVLCLSVLFNWERKGGVAPTAGPISSPSLGRVKWKEMSAADRGLDC